MPAYQIRNGKAERIKQVQFTNESELHVLIDSNLEEMFGIKYIKDEHVTDKHGRIETLAIDESNRPVVIEYKRYKETGQLTQANRYMTWIKQNPDSFELLVRKNIKKFEGEIDFINPRIICFAQEYSIDDKCLALSLGAELWKYRLYENNTLTILREEEPEQLIKSKVGKTTIEKIKKEPRTPKSVEEHLEGASKNLKGLFDVLNDKILELSSEIECYTTKAEIIYKTSVNFAYLAVQNRKDCLRYLIRTENDNLNDPKNITEKIPKTHGYGNITRIIHVFPDKINKEYTVEDIIDLIVQSYSFTQ
jgi:predicted transport protein